MIKNILALFRFRHGNEVIGSVVNW